MPKVREFRTSMLHPPHEERLSRSAMAPVSGGQEALHAQLSLEGRKGARELLN